jgi:hypothetical protein
MPSRGAFGTATCRTAVGPCPGPENGRVAIRSTQVLRHSITRCTLASRVLAGLGSLVMLKKNAVNRLWAEDRF